MIRHAEIYRIWLPLIFAGYLLASHAVLQDESIISFFAQFYSVRETFMNRADIGKATSRADDGNSGARVTLEKEKACILFGWCFQLLPFGIEGVEYGFSIGYLVNHEIDCPYYSLWFYLAVIGQKISRTVKLHIPVVCTTIQW